jgi:predicted ferric reductase
MKPQRLLWLALYFLIPTIPIGLVFSSPPAQLQLDNSLYRLSVVSGALAFVWLVNQLVLSARPKFIEQHFGMDRLYRFHAVMAGVSVVLVIVHRQAKLALTGFTPTYAFPAAALFILAVLIAAVFMIDSPLRRISVVGSLVKFSREKLGLGFNRVVLFHNLTVVASVLMALHVIATSTASIFTPVRIFYWVYFALGLGFYLYHKFFRPWWLGRKAYKVKSVTPELDNIRTLKLIPPAKSEVIDYQPGQFAFITILGGHVALEEHPFTISSSPADPGAITFTIKELGDFTSKLGAVQPGTPVRVDAPYGYFSYQNYAPGRPLGMIAGGIGITPMLSMLRTLRVSEPNRRVTFLWGVNQPEELFCQDELSAMAAEMPNFTWHPVVAFDETWPGEKGYVDRDKIARLMLNGGGVGAEMDFYVCGPQVMMKLVIGHLRDLGVPARRIRSEKFAF